MSKLAALLASHFRLHASGLCIAAWVLPLLATPAAARDLPVPVLKLTQELDTGRLGKLSDDERSVLRLEWRAGMTGVEEGHTVSEMLLSLQRMEQTVADVTRLVRDMPTPKAQAPLPPPPPPTEDYRQLPLAIGGAGLAGLAVGGLAATWWFRRRQPAEKFPLEPAPRTSLEPRQPRPVAPQPLSSSSAPANTNRTATPISPAAPVGAAPRPSEPLPLAAAATTQKLTPGTGLAAREPSAAARPPRAEPAAAPTPHVTVVDFLLEDADPETVAQANSRTPPPAPSKVIAEPSSKAGEDHDPTLELANIMLSMGLADGAAQTLIEYVEANPRQALYHWLKLLDIYNNSSNSKEFKETAEKLRQHFNVQADNWAKAQTGDDPTLENFPHVCEIVQRTWPATKDCIEYLQHLLQDNRAGLRTGFPRPVAEEFLLLIEILKDVRKSAQTGGT